MTSYYEVTEANSRRNLLVSSDQRRKSWKDELAKIIANNVRFERSLLYTIDIASEKGAFETTFFVESRFFIVSKENSRYLGNDIQMVQNWLDSLRALKLKGFVFSLRRIVRDINDPLASDYRPNSPGILINLHW